jgi:hypothetical protein
MTDSMFVISLEKSSFTFCIDISSLMIFSQYNMRICDGVDYIKQQQGCMSTKLVDLNRMYLPCRFRLVGLNMTTATCLFSVQVD